MKTKTVYFLIILLLLNVYSCSDSDDENDDFLGSRDFTFNTAIDPATLIKVDSFRIYSPIIEFAPDPESYTIENNDDLDVFNGTHISDPDEYISLNDLDAYTYFFIRDPDCPEYYDYYDHSYSSDVLTITLDHFREPADTACPAWVTELYVVFKAEKSY